MNKYIITIAYFSLLLGRNLIACTGFYYAANDLVIAGTNEDWINPFSKIWFLPAEEDKFGRVYFGFSEGGVQGGVNDQGLFFDGFATKPLRPLLSENKELFVGDLTEKVMEECRTVDEVLALFNKYNLQFMENAMFFFGDKYGNSVIIEGDVIIRKEGRHQIVTNFYQSTVDPDSITCQRYNNAKRIASGAKSMNIDLIRRILSDTHQEGKYPTQYSNIYDLRNGLIYIYHFHNFENMVEINIEEELKKGRHTIELPALFPQSNASESYKNTIQKEMDKRLAERKVITLENDDLEKYVGVYEFDPETMPGYSVNVSRENNRLFIEISFLDKAEILPESMTDFFLVGTNETFDFNFKPDALEDSIQLTAKMYGMEMRATRSHETSQLK